MRRKVSHSYYYKAVMQERKRALMILGIGAAGLIAGSVFSYRAERESNSCTKQLFAMDTSMSFTAYGENCEEAVDSAVQEVKRLDALLSAGSPDSEISRINQEGGGTVSEDTASILTEALEIYDKSGGLFDFTIYPLMKLWGFPDKQYHVPSEKELEEVRSLVDASEISFSGDRLSLGEGQQIDLGGIAKGYTSERVMEIYREYGIVSGQVSLGGNVQTLNRKPDGSKWRIGIQDPKGPQGQVAAVVQVENQAVVTSGGYERYFEENGKTYIHILNPKTGYPAEGDLLSVSVISEDGMLADALSTTLYLMGLQDAASYWRKWGADFEMVLITDSGKIYVTEGLEKNFQGEETEVIRKTK